MPTYAREATALAREQLKKKWTDLSKQLADLEKEYINLGCRYHFLPVFFRERMVPIELAMDCFSGFTAQATSDTELGYVPDIFHHFASSREYRENAQQALYAGDIPTAERELEYWEELQDCVETDLEILAGHVNALTTRFQGDPYMDNADGAAEAVVMRKVWILALPEVVKAFELNLVETEEQAVAMIISPSQDEILDLAVLGPVVALPGVETLLAAEAAGEAARNNQ